MRLLKKLLTDKTNNYEKDNVNHGTAASCPFIICNGLGTEEIKLTVNNIPNDKGTILIATKSGQWAKVKARKGKIETILHDVPEGKGTIYAFHDENDNKKLDEKDNIPVEYCAFSDYEISAGNNNISIELIYVPDKIMDKQEKNQ